MELLHLNRKIHSLAHRLRDHVRNFTPLPDPIEDPLAPPQPDLESPFTMLELYRAFRRTKIGRATGPDNLPMETLRLLPHPIKKLLLSHNDCLTLGAPQITGNLAKSLPSGNLT